MVKTASFAVAYKNQISKGIWEQYSLFWEDMYYVLCSIVISYYLETRMVNILFEKKFAVMLLPTFEEQYLILLKLSTKKKLVREFLVFPSKWNPIWSSSARIIFPWGIKIKNQNGNLYLTLELKAKIKLKNIYKKTN